MNNSSAADVPRRIAPLIARTLNPKHSQRFAVPAHHEIVESLRRLVFADVIHHEHS
jgi:hypothetical protein